MCVPKNYPFGMAFAEVSIYLFILLSLLGFEKGTEHKTSFYFLSKYFAFPWKH